VGILGITINHRELLMRKMFRVKAFKLSPEVGWEKRSWRQISQEIENLNI
jgi:hypothetical protein